MNPATADRRPRIVRQPRALPTPPADMAYIPPCGPLRPDARWHRARLLAEGWEVRDGRDAWVDRARDFRRRMRELAGDPDSRAKLAAFAPDIAAAHAVYTAGDTFVRGTLEAWLLTGLPSTEIAAECDVTAAVVEAYHALFFDVREKRAAPAWVVCNALGTADLSAVGEGDVDVILKRFALVGGRFVLELVLDAYRHGCAAPADLSAAAVGDLVRLRGRLMGRALVLAWVLPPGQLGRVAALVRLGGELDALIAARSAGAADPGGVAGVCGAEFGLAAEAASTGVGFVATVA